MNVFDFAIGIVLSQLEEHYILRHVSSFILKPQHLRLQMLSVILNDTNLLYQIREIF
jgi:hypothetical protein